MLNYYEILQIPSNASASEIKIAYKKLVLQYHPDRYPDDPEKEEIFKQINTAYHTLSHPDLKQAYDYHAGFNQSFDNLLRVYHKQLDEEIRKKEHIRTVIQEIITQYREQRKKSIAEQHRKFGRRYTIYLLLGILLITGFFIGLDYFFKRTKTVSLYEQAKKSYHSKDYSSADNYVSSAIYLNSQDPSFYILQARIFLEEKKFKEAEASLNNAFTYFETTPSGEWYFCYAIYEYYQTDFPQAQKNLYQAQLRNYAEGDFYFWRALINFNLQADRSWVCDDLHQSWRKGYQDAINYLYLCNHIP